MKTQPAALPYAGDISPREAWDLLARDAHAQLVDVRTQPEWSFAGIPDLTPLRKTALCCEWQRYPEMALNPNFSGEVAAALARAGHREGASIVFLCRTGGRSKAAAIAFTAAGFGPCFSVTGGFEGTLDDARRRGRVAGWQADGLP